MYFGCSEFPGAGEEGGRREEGEDLISPTASK